MGQVLKMLMFAMFVRTVLSYVHILCIDDHEVVNDKRCSVSIRNLDEVKQHQLSQTNVILSITSAVKLSTQLGFEGMVNLTIEGSADLNPMATVICNSSNDGLYISGTHTVLIRNLVFVGCGALHEGTTTDLSGEANKTAKFKSALYIWNCTDVIVTNIDIHNSKGLGLVMFDTGGNIQINSSTFKNNQLDQYVDNMGGGGLYIEFTACPPSTVYGHCEKLHSVNNSQYRIESCTFESNRASLLHPEKSSFVKVIGVKNLTNYQGLGRGGGLAVNLFGRASNNNISVVDCMFYNNHAVSGGGLSLKIGEQASNNFLNFISCEIVNNTGKQTAGGLSISIRLSETQTNAVMFKHCHFKMNYAASGGGLLLLYNNLGSDPSGQNHVSFVKCEWTSNSAEYGAAINGIVYSSQGLGDNQIGFTECRFFLNYVKENKIDLLLGMQELSGTGTFKLTNIDVSFFHTVHFENNTGTALWAVASKIHFSTVTGMFISNQGTDGGAITLMSNSVLFVHDNTLLRFVDNQAASRGGAIFSHSVFENSYLLAAMTCPVQYDGNLPMESRNVSLIFERNKAALDSGGKANNGNSVYMTSIQSCVFLCTSNTSAQRTVDNFFSCVGETKFNSCQNCEEDFEVTTWGYNFIVNNETFQTPLSAVPGRELDLPVMVKDELSHIVDSVYRVKVLSSSEIEVDPAYDYISNRKLKLYGPSQKSGVLHIQLAGLHKMSLMVNFTMMECPPGFYLQREQTRDQNSKNQCICNWKYSSVSAYQGLICNQADSAYLIHGYWAGYVSNTASPKYFGTAFCPQHFCTYNNHSKFTPLYKLPSQASIEIMDNFVCGKSRMGVLCSNCSNGNSVHYHSKQFQCKSNQLCNLGFLFYILSELCPITLLFLAIIILNVSFTSGAFNGFIFFAQVVNSLALNTYDISGVYSSTVIDTLTEVYEFIYRLFNLEFFHIDSLSFCLWKGANTMDLLIFKLVSIVYALVLVIITTVFIKRCSYHIHCIKRHQTQSYIIHGLSAFLISCYVQCAQISFRILTPIYLRGVGSQWNEKLVQYNGTIKYFSLNHLPYAIPALFVISTIVTLPPLYLLWYPAGSKLLSLCHLSESRGVQLVEKLMMIDRMRPLLDSFQSSFKDKCRLFAGLYFLYRLLPLVTYMSAWTLPQFYIAVEIELVIINAIHVAIHPYQKTWHNIVDAFIISDIAMINALSLYIYVKATDLDQTGKESIPTVVTIRLILIYLPLIYVISYLSIIGWSQVNARIFKRRHFSGKSQKSIDNELPARLLYPDEYAPFDECHQL